MVAEVPPKKIHYAVYVSRTDNNEGFNLSLLEQVYSKKQSQGSANASNSILVISDDQGEVVAIINAKGSDPETIYNEILHFNEANLRESIPSGIQITIHCFAILSKFNREQSIIAALAQEVGARTGIWPSMILTKKCKVVENDKKDAAKLATLVLNYGQINSAI